MIGGKIKTLRKSLGLSQADFSSKIGIRQGHLSEIERDISTPSSNLVLSLIRLFPDLNVDFLTGEGQMYAEKEDVLKPDSTTVKPLVNTTGRFNFMNPTEPYYYEAIGRRLAVQEENIREGDVLIVDPALPEIEGDLILRSSPEGPEFVRFKPGEKNLKGVVLALTRQYPATYRKEP
ncbi:MAG: helix-turn-helix transcriptional regulator [Chlorobium sp.]